MSSESQSQPQTIVTGLTGCFQDFQGAYCTRKLTEFLLSLLCLLLAGGVLAAYLWKYRLERKLWLMTIMAFMEGCLLANIFFCFYNEAYWLYAVQSYTYNLYFLFIVGYVCRAYILKGRPTVITRGEQQNGTSLNQAKPENRSKEKTYFYGIFITMTLLYNVIFILSIVRQVNSQREQDSGKGRYCECTFLGYRSESQYLAFDVLCTALSIVVLVILHKNQQEEREKMEGFSQVGRNRPRGSLLSDENDRFGSAQEEPLKGRVHNPLGNVWIWIVTNVIAQIIGLVQSGLLLDATPSQCLIIKDNPTASNYLDLLFTILTMYMAFGVTIWYVVLVGFVRERGGIDRSVIFSQEVKVEGNIELFNPSKEETIYTL